MLIVDVARGGRNSYGHRMGGWKIMIGGITVARMAKAKDARRLARNLRKLFTRKNVDKAEVAAFLAIGQLNDDHDLLETDGERKAVFPVYQEGA